MIELRTLGRIELEGPGRSAARSVLRGPKRLGLLARLALDRPGGHCRRDALLALFWPESDTDRARHALRNTLYELRQALGAEVLPGRGREEVGVDADRLWCDAVAFREAAADGEDDRALELYGGELLPGLHVPGASAAFERWLESERTRLRREAKEAARRRAAEAREAGRIERAVHCARRAAELDPYDETDLRRLMEVLARAGQRAAAVRAYEDFARRAESELGVRPSNETRALAASIRASAPAAGDGAPDARAARAADDVEPSRARGRSPPPGEAEGVGPGAGGLPEAAEEAPAGGPEAGGDDGGRGPGIDAPAGGAGRRLRRAGLAAAALAGLVAAVLLWTGDGGRTGAPNGPAAAGAEGRVAVFPFDVRGESPPAHLGRGLATLLSSGLDGAGGLRAVDPRVLRVPGGERASGTEGEGPSASGMARRLDAQLYVLGAAVPEAGRIHLTAALYRAGSGPPLGRAAVEGDRDDLFGLVDRLAGELLASRYPEDEVPLARHAARTTASLPALKAYLAGEEQFRTGRFASAVASYREAVDADSSFALAHHRLSVTAEWVGDRGLAREAAERAVRHAGRLPRREQRLLDAHLVSLRGDAAAAERRYREILATYPADLEAWYQLGEILFHYGPAVGRSIGEARAAFERVASLSPDHAPSLVHLARIAAAQGRAAEVSRLADRVLELVPGSAQAWEMRALDAVAGEDGADLEALLAGLRDASDRSVRLATWNVAVFGRDLEAAARLARLLTADWRSPEARRLGREWRAELAVARGRWSEARRLLDPGGGPAPGEADPAFHVHRGAFLAALPFLPVEDSTLSALREGLRAPAAGSASLDAGGPRDAPDGSGLVPRLRRFAAALLGSRMGDFRTALDRAAALESPAGGADAVPLGRKLGRIVRAHVAWRRGQPSAALEALGEESVETRSSLMFGVDYVQPFERYLRGRVLEEAGRGREARRWFSSFRHQHVHHLVYLAPSHLRRARILEEAGEAEAARRHYRAFLELWSDPDPALVPLRRAAERRLERLAARP